MRSTLCPPVVLAVFVCMFGVVVSASAQTDRDALIALYNSTGGENWANNTNWNTDEDISAWFGVTVTGGRVTELSMRRNNLSGTFPPEIGDLSALTLLALRDNRLTGSIPAEIGNLAALNRLDLRDNNLSGPIPATLRQLSELSVMFLRLNFLSGPIPSWIPELRNLEVLDLSDNGFTGSVPTDIGVLSSLNTLWLNDNPITGGLPASVGSLTMLRQARFSDTQLSGPLPRTLLELPTCEVPNGCDGVGLFTLTYQRSALCAPADEEFTAWLAGIFTTSGATCTAVPLLPAPASLLLSLLLSALGVCGVRRAYPPPRGTGFRVARTLE